jgi:hypothetical protein
MWAFARSPVQTDIEAAGLVGGAAFVVADAVGWATLEKAAADADFTLLAAGSVTPLGARAVAADLVGGTAVGGPTLAAAGLGGAALLIVSFAARPDAGRIHALRHNDREENTFGIRRAAVVLIFANADRGIGRDAFPVPTDREARSGTGRRAVDAVPAGLAIAVAGHAPATLTFFAEAARLIAAAAVVAVRLRVDAVGFAVGQRIVAATVAGGAHARLVRIGALAVATGLQVQARHVGCAYFAGAALPMGIASKGLGIAGMAVVVRLVASDAEDVVRQATEDIPPEKVLLPVGPQLPHSAHWSHILADAHGEDCAPVRNARPGRTALAAATAMAPMARRRDVVRARCRASASK